VINKQDLDIIYLRPVIRQRHKDAEIMHPALSKSTRIENEKV